MVNHRTGRLFADNLEIPPVAVGGEKVRASALHPRRINAERTLIAAECIGDGRWFYGSQPAMPRPGLR